MLSDARSSRILLLVTLLFGALIGHLYSASNLHVTQASSRQQELAALQTARGAMDLIQYDLERAGYAAIHPATGSIAVRVIHQDRLTLQHVDDRTIALRSPDGQQT